ncbi:MAG: hypothetical protein HY960_03240 [Ignavibacteriae bacterium]|nr:hypothetical protein [Ignavibacteriota bacterium]
MLRYLLYLLLFWVVWRLIRNTKIVVTKHRQQPFQQPQQQRDGTFKHVQDAEFEDVTPGSEEKK